MLVGNIPSSDNINKDSARFARERSKVSLKKESKLYYVRGTKGRGGRGLGRFLEVTELFMDHATNHVFVGYKTKDRSGHFYQYVIIGILEAMEEVLKE